MRDIDKIITSYKGVAKEVKDELAKDILSDGFDNEAQALGFAEEVEQIAEWLTELQERRATEPIVYEITENSQGFTVETNDDRNIGLKKVSTSNLIYAMREITEKYWDEGLRVVFKYYCGNGDEWQKFYESEDK